MCYDLSPPRITVSYHTNANPSSKMAIASLPTNPESWARWPYPQHDGTDSSMTPTSMISYDCRTTTAAHIPRPELSQHFVPTTFSSAPMPPPPSPHYHALISYDGYNPYSAPPMLDAPFKPQESMERLQPRCMVQQPVTNGGVQGRLDGMPFIGRSCSPSVKSEADSTLSSSPFPKAVASNGRTQATPVHQFDTAIDNIMRMIEAKREILGPLDEVELVQADEKKEAVKNNKVC